MKFTLRILAVAVLLTAFSGVALADDEPGGSGFTIPNPLTCANFQDCLGRIIQGLIILAAPVVVVMVIVGAYQILTGRAEPENISKGKKTIIYAVIGFAIILLAQAFVFILQDLIGISGGSCTGSPPQGPCEIDGGPIRCIDGQWGCPTSSILVPSWIAQNR